MINLGPISRRVRETLVKREKAVSRLSSNNKNITTRKTKIPN